MHISVDNQEVETLFDDVWFKVDAIIHNGIELATCKQEDRIRFLRSTIEVDTAFVCGLFSSLSRLGLRSVVKILRDKLRQRLNRDRPSYSYKVDVFALSYLQTITFYRSAVC